LAAWQSQRKQKTRSQKKKAPSRFSLWRLFLFFDLCLAAIIAFYLFYLYVEIEQRFGSQKWSIPSRVFSATVPVFPGQSMSLSQMKQMLEVRRYRAAARDSLSAGEYKAGRDSLIVHFREFRFPGHSIPAQKVQFSFQQNRISKMKGDTGDLAYLELEPVEAARLFGPERESRALVKFDQVSQHLIAAVLAIEDHRFYEHGGVDVWGIARALWQDLSARRVVQGGSTITQQLVKNYFLEPQRTFKRKVVEFCMALIIEATHEKDEILEMYLNEIYLGQRGSVAIHGVGEAARYYFGRNVEDLTLAEAAVIAGMIRAPNSYSPLQNPQAAKERRNTVLKRMEDLGKISHEVYEKTVAEPIEASEVILPVKAAPYFVDYLRQQLKDLYEPEVLENEGLNIYTTLHPEMALAAEEAVRDGLTALEKRYPRLKGKGAQEPLQAVLIAVQPKTGAVLALAGGRDYAKSSFNRALYAYRQPGSAIKPFVYLTALDQFTPASWLPDELTTYVVEGKNWSPQNYDGQYRGRVTMRQALEQSLNIPTVHLAFAAGLGNIITTAQSVGIKSPIKPAPSLALGAFEVTPIELAGAYAALDNDGQKPYLLSLKEVVTETGEVQQRRNVDITSVTTPAKSYIITNMLEGVMTRGTAKSGRQLGVDFPCAGKTGTTSEYRDSWFVGYTTDLLVLVWVGFDDNRTTHLSGAQGALGIWCKFVNRVRPWINPQPFRPPPGVEERIICNSSGLQATPFCTDKRLEVFLSGQAPTEYCPIHAIGVN
jgi:penicillin-binding protein 1B